MINISSWSLQQIIHRFIIHICGADSGQFFPVLARRVCRNNAGTVKTIQRHNLNLFHLDNISRLHNNTAFFGNAPLHPCFHRFLWPDKRNWNLLAIFIRSHHPALDDVCCPFRRHVVLMIMGRKHCIDLHQPQIPEGLNFGYFEFMGLGTVIDSLAAIKKLVFEDKKLTMDQLIDALEANFEGYEDIQQLLRTAPCYGNDDEYADEIGRELDRMAVSFAAKYGKEMGINNDARYVPFTSHVPFGKVVSATPNGRVAWFPLADGSSPSHGADHNGPTAILLSNHNTKNYGMRARAARLINVKFTPKCVEGDAGTEKLVQFIRTWCDLKLWHIQFNVINADTLKKAQKDPQKYRNLIVRIAGYSAYFVDLTPDLQNDLIARTGHDQM